MGVLPQIEVHTVLFHMMFSDIILTCSEVN